LPFGIIGDVGDNAPGRGIARGCNGAAGMTPGGSIPGGWTGRVPPAGRTGFAGADGRTGVGIVRGADGCTGCGGSGSRGLWIGGVNG
jgi:hypothetical protein